MKRLILTYTQSCNLTCDFCYVSFHNRKIEDKSMEIVLRAIDLGFNIITFGGGDAFSKKLFREACRLCNENGVKTHVDTNTIAIRKDDYDFINKYVDLLGISLDGMGTVHNDMRKSNNLFQKVANVLETSNHLDLKVKINTVLTKKNIQDISNIYEYLKSLNNISIWSIYQFFPLDAAKRYSDDFIISDSEYDNAVNVLDFSSLNFKVEKFKFSDRVSGYVFSDELGNLYTNSIEGNYIDIGSIFEEGIEMKLGCLNINPKVEYRY